MKMIYPAVFYPYSDGSGGYVVEFPDLPGCVTGGKNLQEAIEMATDAASGWVLDINFSQVLQEALLSKATKVK